MYGDTDTVMHVVDERARALNLMQLLVKAMLNTVTLNLTGHPEVKREAQCEDYATTEPECRTMVLLTKKHYVMRIRVVWAPEKNQCFLGQVARLNRKSKNNSACLKK